MQRIQNGIFTFSPNPPFSPLARTQFEFVDCRPCWGQWKVFYCAEDGQVSFFPASWTDIAQADPFVALSRGRSLVRSQERLK
jgi:hypothetical protein